jgi:hypothetical protein
VGQGEAMKSEPGFILIVVFLVLIQTGVVRAQDIVASTMSRVHDPVQVPGDLLKAFHGKRLDSLRLYAFRNGSMCPIVYQFDERLPDGTFIMDMGEGANADKHNYILDPQDLLVLRISDTGDRVPRKAWPSREGIEIELEDPLDKGLSYCYLFRFSENVPARLEENTVVLEHWDPWERPDIPFIVSGLSFKIEGLVNKIKGRYYKTAVNKTFQVPPSAGGADVNILDGQKMRAFCELLFGKIRVDADETNMIGGIDSISQGYVRGYGRQWLTVALPLGLEAPRVYSDVFTYDRVIVSPMQLNIPFNPGSIITRAGIEFGYDLNEAAYGMRFYSPNCMDGVTIDGKMSEKERALSTDWVPWFLITGPQASLIFRVDIERALVDQTIDHLTYIDDREQAFPPEDIPGSIGYQQTTIEMKSVRAGHYDFRIEWYFPPNFYKDGGYDKKMLQEFLDIKDAPLIIRVDGITAENHSIDPPPLCPKK